MSEFKGILKNDLEAMSFYKPVAGQGKVIYVVRKIQCIVSPHMRQLANQAGTYPGFCSMKWLGVFILPPGWDASPSQGYPPALNSLVPFTHFGGERHCESNMSSPTTQHNVPGQSSNPEYKHTNHEATTLPAKPTPGKVNIILYIQEAAMCIYGHACLYIFHFLYT